MPIRWFLCPDGGRIVVADCLSEGGCRREHRCATRSYLQLVSSERVWTGKPSTTQCIGGTMLASLRLTHDYAISPDDRAFMIHGTRSHGNLQAHDDPYSLLEERLDGDDTPETGIFDVFESEGNRNVLVDYKTSGSFKVAKALGWYVDKVPTGVLYKSGPRKGEPRFEKQLKRDDAMVDRWEWELQLNKYRIELERRGFRVDEMRVMCIVRDGNTYIARSRGVFRNIYYFAIARLPDDDVRAYFRRKRNALAVALRYGWSEPCTAEENWDGIRCSRYCEVAEFCPYGKYLRREKESEDMPIKGLSDIRRLPRLGKVALGIKKISEKTGKEHPAEVDYFVLRPGTASEEESNRLIAMFHRLYGNQPKSIQIMLPLSNRELIFPQYYKRYGSSSGLKCRGDGETAVCMSNEHAENLKVIGDREGLPEVECKGKDCIYQLCKPRQCTRCATLQVLLPELEGAGVWQITTSSFHSIVNINSGLDYIEDMAGRVHMVPLTLQRRPQDTVFEGQSRTHYMLHIDMAVSLKELMRWAQVDEKQVLLELPAPSSELEDIMFEQTSDETINKGTPALPPKKDPPPPPPNGEITYANLLIGLCDAWNEDKVAVGRFLKETYGTEGKATLQLKTADRDALRIKYQAWVDKLADADAEKSGNGEPEQETETVGIEDFRLGEIKDLLPKTDLGKTLKTQKFRNWWTTLLKVEPNTDIESLTFDQGEAILNALRLLVAPEGEDGQDDLDF